MANDELFCVGKECRGAAGAVLKTGAVKAVAADALFVPRVRAGVEKGRFWQCVMKGCVKNGVLRRFREPFADELYAFEFAQIM